MDGSLGVFILCITILTKLFVGFLTMLLAGSQFFTKKLMKYFVSARSSETKTKYSRKELYYLNLNLHLTQEQKQKLCK